MTERFRAMDGNGDGFVGVDEFDAHHKAMFSTMDASGDGALTAEEFASKRRGGGAGLNPQKQQRREERKGAWFKAMDTDGDGKVSEQEFVAAGGKRFAAMDTSGDQKISAEEFRAGRRGEPVQQNPASPR
jgi:Ca2+-binding EF-hand superfamily protein